MSDEVTRLKKALAGMTRRRDYWKEQENDWHPLFEAREKQLMGNIGRLQSQLAEAKAQTDDAVRIYEATAQRLQAARRTAEDWLQEWRIRAEVAEAHLARLEGKK